MTLDPREAAERAVSEIQEAGKIDSSDLKRLFNRGRSLTPEEKALRDELFPIVFDLCGRSWTQLKRKTGMHKTTAQRLLKARRQAIEARPDGPVQELGHETRLEEIRFEGRKQLIDLCFDGAAKALQHGIERIKDMKGLEAIKAGAILTDKGLLLAGQPTSRVARTDEKMLSDEELAERLKKYKERRAGFSLIEGSGRASEGS